MTGPDAAQVLAVLQAVDFTYADEYDLQEAIAAALTAAGLPAAREVPLGALRVDVLVGRIGVEVKIKGSPSDVVRQLQRYAHSDRIDELVLATTRSAHLAVPQTLAGKPVHVCPLWRAAR